ncbi:MAG TPA: nucleotidyltransferase family protein [Thermoanaerobaculia bacterium]|nr:nucleotidyltransferase family protein [Thermoanaerobaculia bacterium]
MTSPRVAAVVLAAGGSTRIGRPKVLLQIGGEPLIRRVVQTAAASGLAPIIVVAGSDLAGVTAALLGLDAKIVENAAWRDGLSSSIRAGIEALPGSVHAAVVLLADQPFVTSEHLRDLVQAYAAGSDPVATRYGQGRGVPALFGSKWFGELRSIEGDRGAKEILDRSGAAMVGDGAPPIDIDTDEDYERALRR